MATRRPLAVAARLPGDRPARPVRFSPLLVTVPPREPVTAYVALGANLGDARAAVLQAFDALDQLPQTRVTARSPLYRSAPWQASGPDFVNAVAQVQTTRTAPRLLDDLLQLEQRAGRERPYPNAPRTLDLDLLLYGDARIASPRLTLPHPRMRERAFVLVPLAQIAPQLVQPSELAALTSQVMDRLI